MPTYDVKITAKITKTIRVEAENEDEATELGHELFSPRCDGAEEDYNQETDSVTEVEEE